MKIDPWLVFQVIAGPLVADVELVLSIPVVVVSPTAGGLNVRGFSLGGAAGTGGAAGDVLILSTGSGAAATYTLDGENGAAGAPARFAVDTLVGFGTSNRMASMQAYDAVSQRWRRIG